VPPFKTVTRRFSYKPTPTESVCGMVKLQTAILVNHILTGLIFGAHFLEFTSLQIDCLQVNLSANHSVTIKTDMHAFIILLCIFILHIFVYTYYLV